MLVGCTCPKTATRAHRWLVERQGSAVQAGKSKKRHTSCAGMWSKTAFATASSSMQARGELTAELLTVRITRLASAFLLRSYPKLSYQTMQPSFPDAGTRQAHG